MTTIQNKKYIAVDVKPYRPYGIPILIFLMSIGAIALVIVGLYEWLI